MGNIEVEDLDEEDFKDGKEEEVVGASQKNGEKEDRDLTWVKPRESILLVGEVNDCSIFLFVFPSWRNLFVPGIHTKQFNLNFSLSFIDVTP